MKKRGFTLSEMIVSVAILAILSTYIIQIFITTKNLSQKAFDVDNSVRISKNIIELISSGENIENSDQEIFKSMIDSGDKSLPKDEKRYVLNLDKDFKITEDTQNPSYKVNMDIIKNDDLADIKINVIRINPYLLDKNNQGKTIVISDIQSTKKIKK